MCLLGVVFGLGLPALAADPGARVSLETSKGLIVLEIDVQAAPATAANFIEYVNAGFYDQTVFHRVIPNFMIQGGGLNSELEKKATRKAIANEAANGLKNTRGTVAMARTMDPHSATAQFFINTVDNPFLDHRDQSPAGWGYCVFGKVVEGMAVVDAIAKVPTTVKKGLKDVPAEPVIIEKAVVVP
jgi:cyclophilin family peptidyl-prolyl cis-trans isomerase